MRDGIISFLSVFMTLAVSSAIAARPADNSKVEQAIRKTEKQRVDAFVAADIPTLERLLADDLTYTHASAQTQTKAEFLADFKSGKRVFKSMKNADVQVRVYGKSAVLTGETDLTVVNGGKELELPLRFIEVYENRDGQWQVVAFQATRLPK